jgi:hypothetical protein
MTRAQKKNALMRDFNVIITKDSYNAKNILFEIVNILGEDILGPVNEKSAIYHWGHIVQRVLDNDKFDEAKWKIEEEILTRI